MRKFNNLIAVLFLILFTSVVIVSSCKKDEESTMTKQEMLTSKPWKISTSKTNGVASTIEACNLDDILTFATDGTYTNNIGTIKCSANEKNFTSTWSLSADEKNLIANGTSLNLVELTNSIFVYSMTSGSITIVVTYIH